MNKNPFVIASFFSAAKRLRPAVALPVLQSDQLSSVRVLHGHRHVSPWRHAKGPPPVSSLELNVLAEDVLSFEQFRVHQDASERLGRLLASGQSRKGRGNQVHGN